MILDIIEETIKLEIKKLLIYIVMIFSILKKKVLKKVSEMRRSQGLYNI